MSTFAPREPSKLWTVIQFPMKSKIRLFRYPDINRQITEPHMIMVSSHGVDFCLALCGKKRRLIRRLMDKITSITAHVQRYMLVPYAAVSGFITSPRGVL